MADDARFERYDRIIDQLQGFVAQQMVLNARYEVLHEEQKAITQAQLVFKQELHEMHADLRAVFVSLEQRLDRIVQLLERSLPGSTNGRDA